MNRIQHIHFLLGEKYGHDNIGLLNVVSSIIEAKEEILDNNIIWTITDNVKKRIIGHKYININTKEIIDLKKEKESGLFN